jgi:hypothetical protein
MSKSPIDQAKAKLKNTVMGLFMVAFLLGVAHQLIVPLIYAAGLFAAIFLFRLAVARWLRR